MRVTGTSHFRGPRPLVWELLQDPDVWSKALPGAQRLVRTADDHYEGVMKAAVDLKDAEDGGTLMEYVSDFEIGGQVASVGQGVVDTAAKSMTEKGLEALQREVDERIAARGGGTEM